MTTSVDSPDTGSAILYLHLILVFLFSLAIGCSPDPFRDKQKIQISGKTMGTTYTISFFLDSEELDLQADIEQEWKRLEKIFSTYIPDSEISRFNEGYKVGQVYPLSDEILEVWDLSLEVHKESEGAFDVLLGRLVEGWGFGPSENKTPLSEEELDRIFLCKSSVRMEKVSRGLLPVKKPGFPEECMDKKYRPKLDFSGIAKGYAIDRILDYLRYNGIEVAMVEAGGDLCVSSSIHQPYSWTIGIRSPQKWGLSRTLQLSNGCVATSGNSYQRIRWKDKEYTHILDPGTGLPLTRELSSVSVVIENFSRAGARSDAWATALYILGPKRSKEFQEKKGFQVYYSQ